MEEIKINPKCINDGMDFAVSNRGYLLPCCYCDIPRMYEDPEFAKLVAVSKISDYDNIEQILNTKQWKRFYKNLQRNKGPYACRTVCRVDKSKLQTRVSTLIDTRTDNIIEVKKA